MEEFSREAVERALSAILADVRFVSARRMSAFLAYVVRQTLDGNGARIKAYTVGVEALEKPESFDPQVDPSVRVLAKRLRSSLTDYHERHPHASPVIEIRCGSYRPIFSAPGIGELAGGLSGTDRDGASGGEHRRGADAVPSVYVLATNHPGTLDAQLAAVIRGVLSQTPDIRIVRRDSRAGSGEYAPGPEDYELWLEVLPLDRERRIELQLLRARDGQLLDGLTLRMATDEQRRPLGTVTSSVMVSEIENFVAGIGRPGRALMNDYVAHARQTVTS